MSNILHEKPQFLETNFTYSNTAKGGFFQNFHENIKKEKQNVVPCAALFQSYISTLNSKKCVLKNLQVQTQQLKQLSFEQNRRQDQQRIREQFEVERQQEILSKNKKLLNQLEKMKMQKLKLMQQMLAAKGPLQSRYQQIIQLTNLKQSTIIETSVIQSKINQKQEENEKIMSHIDQLELAAQNLNNQFYQMRQNQRLNQVNKTTVESALSSIKRKIQLTAQQIKLQNKNYKQMSQQLKQTNDKIRKNKQETHSNQITTHQFAEKNQQIVNINIMLKSDLQKCKLHLRCLLKNNQLLQNSIEEFSFIDSKVTQLINRNQINRS